MQRQRAVEHPETHGEREDAHGRQQEATPSKRSPVGRVALWRQRRAHHQDRQRCDGEDDEVRREREVRTGQRAEPRARDTTQPVGRHHTRQPSVLVAGEVLDRRQDCADPQCTRAEPHHGPGRKPDGKPFEQHEGERSGDEQDDRAVEGSGGPESPGQQRSERESERLTDREDADERPERQRARPGLVLDRGQHGRDHTEPHRVECREVDESGEGPPRQTANRQPHPSRLYGSRRDRARGWHPQGDVPAADAARARPRLPAAG